MKRKKIILFLLSVLLLLSVFPSLFASADTPDTEDAQVCLLYHYNSKSIAYEKNADVQVSAGAVMKVLSGWQFCELLSERMQETVTVTYDMIKTASGYRYGFDIGDTLTIKDLLYASVCGGYNDAFTVLSCVASGNVTAFVSHCNETALQLGCEKTMMSNPCGYPDGSVTTANELLILAKEAYKNKTYLSICQAETYEMPTVTSKEGKTIYNRNYLVGSHFSTAYYNGNAMGFCTGETDESGSCAVAVTEKNGEIYFCIVLGGETYDGIYYGYRICNRLLDWAYKTYSYRLLCDTDIKLDNVTVSGSDLTDEIEIALKEPMYAYLSKSVSVDNDITYSIRLETTELQAPIQEGETIGYYLAIYQGKVIAKGELVALTTAEKGNFKSAMNVVTTWFDNPGRTVGTCFFLAGILVMILAEIGWKHHWCKKFKIFLRLLFKKRII